MLNVKFAAPIVSAFMLAACGQRGVEMSSRFIPMDTPDWAKGLAVKVGSHECRITMESGFTQSVGFKNTALDDKRWATRDPNTCTVYNSDVNGVWCQWSAGSTQPKCEAIDQSNGASVAAQQNAYRALSLIR